MPYTGHVVITIPAANIPISVTNYTFLFTGTYAFLAGTGSGGSVTSSLGYDIIFTSDAAGTIILDFEQTFYDPTTGTVEYHIRTQPVAATNYVIYCYFGNSSITTYLGNDTGVWNSSWRAVWHLGNGTTPSGKDSTINANNGTPTGSPAAVAGKIDGAVSFTGALDIYNLVNSTSLRVSPSFTFRFWINPSSYNAGDGVVASLLDGLGNFNYIVAITSAGVTEFAYRNGASTPVLLDTTTIPLSTWTQITIVVTAPGLTNVSFWINGVHSSTQTSTIAVPGAFPGGFASIGNITNANVIDAALDELEIYSGAMSTGLITMLYSNEDTPGTFYTVASNNAWSETAFGTINLTGAATGNIGHVAAASGVIELTGTSGNSQGFANNPASGVIILGQSSNGSVGYNSETPHGTLELTGGAIVTVGEVPLKCITGDDSDKPIPPTVGTRHYAY